MNKKQFICRHGDKEDLLEKSIEWREEGLLYRAMRHSLGTLASHKAGHTSGLANFWMHGWMRFGSWLSLERPRGDWSLVLYTRYLMSSPVPRWLWGERQRFLVGAWLNLTGCISAGYFQGLNSEIQLPTEQTPNKPRACISKCTLFIYFDNSSVSLIIYNTSYCTGVDFCKNNEALVVQHPWSHLQGKGEAGSHSLMWGGRKM